MRTSNDGIMSENNRKRIEELSIGRQDRLDDWFPTMDNIIALNPDSDKDREFLYWVYTHAGELTEKQREVKNRIAELLGIKPDSK